MGQGLRKNTYLIKEYYNLRRNEILDKKKCTKKENTIKYYCHKLQMQIN